MSHWIKQEFSRTLSERSTGDFIDTVARLGHKGGIIGGVGKDDFGKCLLDRLKSDGVDVSHVIENPKSYRMCDCNIF